MTAIPPSSSCRARLISHPSQENPGKPFFCPRVHPHETVTACCPRLGRYCCVPFMCNGRAPLMLGPDWTVTVFCLWPTVLTPTGLYTYFAIPWIYTHSQVLAYISIAVILFFWATLFVATCTNPGIVMKFNEPDPDAKSESTSRATKRFCQKCKLYSPARTSHCGQCGVCVYGYDHHCGFMGQCVGGNTIMAFQLFLGGICFVTVFMIVSLMITNSIS